jgi:predicted adenine nucleotide alpha hydrolase (AANH) superfamily ATPase
MAESVKDSGFEEVAIYYYNPNIHPRSEYQARLAAMQKVFVDSKLKLIIADWSPREYFGTVKSKDGRCPKCWGLRLEKTALYAKEKGFDSFSSTLVTSQYQNREVVEKIGKEIGEKYGIEFWIPDKVCCDLKTAGFYKQFYCGCVYSLSERFEEKYQGE